MKIKIINPNTTLKMTEEVEKIAKKYAAEGTEIYAVSPSTGPDSVEGLYDEVLAAPGVVSEIIKGDREEHADAYIIACFGDPGLEAAREVTDKPVIGIAQAAISVARLMAPNFSILYVLDRSQKIIENVLRLHHAEKECCSIRSIGMGVLEFEDKEKLLTALMEKGKLCMEQDGAECILLGCAGYVQFAEIMRERLGILVLDGVVPAVKLCEAMVDMGVKIPKKILCGYPDKGKVKGFDELTKY